MEENPLLKPVIRRCVACRREAPREQMWRLVRDHATRCVQLDQGMGRSAYICTSARCLEEAKKKQRLSKALRAPVPLDILDDFAQRLQNGPNGQLPPSGGSHH